MQNSIHKKGRAGGWKASSTGNVLILQTQAHLFDPEAFFKKPGVVAYTGNPSAGEMETVASPGLDDQASLA